MQVQLVDLGAIAASILFIFGLKMLSRASSARRGNAISSLGMLIAVVAVLSTGGLDYKWIALGVIIGSLIGAIASHFVKMTAMPEMVALFNGTGGVASLLVGWAEFLHGTAASDGFTAATMFAAVLIGGLCFTGSLIAWGKLSEKISSKPLKFPGMQWFNLLVVLAAVALGVFFTLERELDSVMSVLVVVTALSLVLGVTAVIGIGGADMPVVISLLNSYSGIAACAAGFVIRSNVLIVSGALVGASGIILTNIMCKAMNRSLANVLFGGLGATSGSAAAKSGAEAKVISIEDAYFVLEAAQSVLVVPGYGMAVAQAQHAVRELGELLEANGAEVRYAIHPVAGRMPGHMNVLLAEANVTYEQLVEPDDVNPAMETIDVCIVIGANDVVNPAARSEQSSPIYGMPIIDVDRARTVFVLKRSLGTGFAGVENPLFFNPNTRMLLGDAKQSVTGLIAQFKET